MGASPHPTRSPFRAMRARRTATTAPAKFAEPGDPHCGLLGIRDAQCARSPLSTPQHGSHRKSSTCSSTCAAVRPPPAARAGNDVLRLGPWPSLAQHSCARRAFGQSRCAATAPIFLEYGGAGGIPAQKLGPNSRAALGGCTAPCCSAEGYERFGAKRMRWCMRGFARRRRVWPERDATRARGLDARAWGGAARRVGRRPSATAPPSARLLLPVLRTSMPTNCFFFGTSRPDGEVRGGRRALDFPLVRAPSAVPRAEG